ncbi:hypothetical protein TNCV_220721 [Trichonephila clavipes]|nr:hypothetical protein TNCV_220721 [Trichonephila clavipes]
MPQTLDHLEDNIRRVIADIRPQMLEKVIKIGRPDWTTSEPAVAVICQKSYLKFAFSQRSSSPRLIEDNTFDDSEIINNLIDYEDEREEPDSLIGDKNMQGSNFPTNWQIYRNSKPVASIKQAMLTVLGKGP